MLLSWSVFSAHFTHSAWIDHVIMRQACSPRNSLLVLLRIWKAVSSHFRTSSCLAGFVEFRGMCRRYHCWHPLLASSLAAFSWLGSLACRFFLSRTITHVLVMLPERGRLQAPTAWGNGGVAEHATAPMATPALFWPMTMCCIRTWLALTT